MRRTLARLADVARAADWWSYKIPPLLAIAYGAWLAGGAAPAAWAGAMATIAALLCVAVFGYVLNDACDVEADRLAGRRNRMAGVGAAGRGLALAAPALGALGIGAALGDPVIAVLLALNLLLPVLYSVPPLRLKGRGGWGALLDAGGVHLLPALAVAWAGTAGAASSFPRAAFLGTVGAWSLFTGLRGIVLHQVADDEADRLAGVRTLVGRIGVPRARVLVLWLLLPAELACLALLLSPLAPFPLPGAAVFLVVALEALKRARGWIQPVFEKAAQSRERYRPFLNNELYEVWLPCALVLQLAWRQPLGWLLAGAHLLLFHANLRRGLAQALQACRPPARALPKPAPQAAGPRVVIGATTWTVNGVNVFSANLARGLAAAGIEATVLLTEEDSDLISSTERPLPRPDDVRFTSLGLHHAASWGAHWGALVRRLEADAPCVYIPNSDWRHSSVCPRLSDKVIVVGVVHSDDPLHYDHVRRLAPYWNMAVAVSQAVARRTLELCPELAGRLVTIPIGVPIPASQPARAPEDGVLRLIYHGILKQHQKRVLDLPRIVAAAAARGIPARLTIVGAGPDEEALRAACAPLVERGLVHFHGLVAPGEVGALLERHDVYLLASEFEGMPNALIEAMGRGCVPLVSRMDSGIPELVRDGENGFMAPIGDADAFAERLGALWADPALRARMAACAYASVRDGGFGVDAMVAAYRAAFERAAADAAAGRYRRPQGPLAHPPASVAGVSLFPVPLPHTLPGVGDFVSIDDAEDYLEQLEAPASAQAPAPRPPRGLRVFVAAPVWTGNGVNAWSEDVVRGLRGAGLDAALLLTEENTRMVQIDEARLARPDDVPVLELDVDGADNWGARWGAMIRLLEASAPCVYLPTYDWRHSCIVPALSERVTVIGGFHDAGPLYLEHAARLGRYWNAALATDRRIARQVRQQLPELADRLAVIPHGHWCAATERAAPRLAAPCVLLLEPCDADGAGWLASVGAALADGLPGSRFVMADPGPAMRPLLAKLGATVLERPNRQQWLELLRHVDLVAAPDVDGRNHGALLEAMAQGAPALGPAALARRWPALSNSGALLAAGDEGAVLAALAPLRAPGAGADAAALAARARAFAADTGYNGTQMLDAMLGLIGRALATPVAGRRRGARGPVLPPPAEVGGTSILTVELAHRSPHGHFPSAVDASSYAAEASRRNPLQSEPA